MSRGRLALVADPDLDYCTDYHCAGDCGLPHNSQERKEYAGHVLKAFADMERKDRRQRKEQTLDVRHKAKNQL